jgi:hypothetical protein
VSKAWPEAELDQFASGRADQHDFHELLFIAPGTVVRRTERGGQGIPIVGLRPQGWTSMPGMAGSGPGRPQSPPISRPCARCIAGVAAIGKVVRVRQVRCSTFNRAVASMGVALGVSA